MLGQEAWERPGTSILARPSLCGSGKTRSTGLHILTVGVDGELAAVDVLVGDGVGQQPLGQRGLFGVGDRPATASSWKMSPKKITYRW